MADQPKPVPYAFMPGHPDWLRSFVFAQGLAPRGGLNGGRRPAPPTDPQRDPEPKKPDEAPR